VAGALRSYKVLKPKQLACALTWRGGGVSWNQGVAKATQGAITTSVTLQLQKRKTLTIVFTTCFGERLLERIQYF
jgi:hypothetical protein